MTTLLLLAGVALAGLVVAWSIMWLLARRLPEGPLRDAIEMLPNLVTMVRRLRHDRRVPRSVKLALAAVVVYLASPIDFVPDFLPVIGHVDDVVVVLLLVLWMARRVPRPALEEAWPGDPAMLDRLLRRR